MGIKNLISKIAGAAPEHTERAASAAEANGASAATATATPPTGSRAVGPLEIAPVPPPDQRQPGMGALPLPSGRGCAFRVWAPHAESIEVLGPWNNFAATGAHGMSPEENGHWYTEVAEARVGDEYQYFIRNGEQQLVKTDPRALAVTNSIGKGIIYDHAAFDWKGDQRLTPDWSKAIIYEMHVGTFHDPNPNDDKPGNFYQAAKRLDHLVKLGANCVQVMPITEFSGERSWGYNPSFLYAIEQCYGGPDAFKHFVRRAHQLGIAVILDVVYNHMGPMDIDIWRFDGWGEGEGEEEGGGIYFYNDWRKQTPWGSTRLDYGRAEVRQFLRDNALMWCEHFHLDGLRWDATFYIRTVRGNEIEDNTELPEGWSLMQWLNDEVHTQYPGTLTIGEDLQNDEWLCKSTGAGGAGFGSQWDAGYVYPLRDVLFQPDDANRDMQVVADIITKKYCDNATSRVIYTESHDDVANGKQRIPTSISPDDKTDLYAVKRSVLGAACVFTSPGIPMIFQGQEFLEGGYFEDTEPLDWDNSKEFSGILRLYHDLIKLRTGETPGAAGLHGQHVNMYHVNHENKIIAYHRWENGGPGDDVLVIANFSNAAYEGYVVGSPVAAQWKVLVNTDWTGYSKQFSNTTCLDPATEEGEKDGFPQHLRVGLGPYSVIILGRE